jgi:hypothetical protein
MHLSPCVTRSKKIFRIFENCKKHLRAFVEQALYTIVLNNCLSPELKPCGART